MAETRYIISDAARMINVEPHVLRYWEEELAIQIPRNELGHRYYTDKEIQLFENIRDLKEKGFQLKAIRLIISTLNEDAPFGKTGSEDEHMTEEELAAANTGQLAEECEKEPMAPPKQMVPEEKKDEEKTEKKPQQTDRMPAVSDKDRPEAAGEEGIKRVSPADKMKHFKYIMDGIVTEALVKNNERLEDVMASQVTDIVMQEIGKMEERQERQSERYYKLLDEAIRGRQRNSQEVAAAKVPSYSAAKLPRRRKRLFKRKFKY